MERLKVKWKINNLSIIEVHFESRILWVNGTTTLNFLRSMRVKLLLQEKDLDKALGGKDVSNTRLGKAFTVIATSFCDNPIRANESCNSAEKARDKL